METAHFSQLSGPHTAYMPSLPSQRHGYVLFCIQSRPHTSGRLYPLAFPTHTCSVGYNESLSMLLTHELCMLLTHELPRALPLLYSEN